MSAKQPGVLLDESAAGQDFNPHWWTEGSHAFLPHAQNSAVTLDASGYPGSIVGAHMEEQQGLTMCGVGKPCGSLCKILDPGPARQQASGDIRSDWQTATSIPLRKEFSVMVSLTFAPFCRHKVSAELALRGLQKHLVCPQRCSGQLQVDQELSSCHQSSQASSLPHLNIPPPLPAGPQPPAVPAPFLCVAQLLPSIHFCKTLIFPDGAQLPLSPCCSLT